MFLIAVGISPQLLYLLNLHINFLTVAPGGEDSQMSVKIWGYVQGSKSQSCKSRYIVTLKGNKVLKNFRECFLKTMKLRSQLKTRTLWVSRSAIDFWGSFGSLAMHRSHLWLQRWFGACCCPWTFNVKAINYSASVGYSRMISFSTDVG